MGKLMTLTFETPQTPHTKHTLEQALMLRCLDAAKVYVEWVAGFSTLLLNQTELRVYQSDTHIATIIDNRGLNHG
jgi:hypothetical protein